MMIIIIIIITTPNYTPNIWPSSAHPPATHLQVLELGSGPSGKRIKILAASGEEGRSWHDLIADSWG